MVQHRGGGGGVSGRVWRIHRGLELPPVQWLLGLIGIKEDLEVGIGESSAWGWTPNPKLG